MKSFSDWLDDNIANTRDALSRKNMAPAAGTEKHDAAAESVIAYVGPTGEPQEYIWGEDTAGGWGQLVSP